MYNYFEGKNKENMLANISSMHSFSLQLLSYGLFPKVEIDTKGLDLSVNYGEYKFKNPLGVAAGVDKDQIWVDSFFDLGFGFVEIGDFTLEPEKRDDRLQPTDSNEKVLENTKNIIWKNVYMNDGIISIISKLCIRQEKILKGEIKPQDWWLIGLNITPSKSTIDSVPYLIKSDYENSIDHVVEFSDYIVINISERDKTKRQAIIGLRRKDELTKLIRKVKKRLALNIGKIAALEYSKLENTNQSSEAILNIHNEIRKAMFRNSLISKNVVPLILLKIDSYWTEEEYKTIAEVIMKENIDGAIVGSTIPINVGLKDKSKWIVPDDVAIGGAGGEVTAPYALNSLKLMHKYTEGKKLLISSGGVFTGRDLYERLENGANLVQIYSALAFRGPYVAKYILEEYADILKRKGKSS